MTLKPYIPGKEAARRAKIQHLMRRDVELKRMWRRVWASQRVYVGHPGSYKGMPACLEAQTRGAGGGTSDGSGDVPWNDPDDIDAEEAIAAHALMPSGGGYTAFLISNTHGFSIPTGATINGVFVRISISRDVLSNVYTYAVQLTKDGSTLAGSPKSGVNPWPVLQAQEVYGEADDLWGTGGITPAEANASTFGVMLKANTPSGSVITTAYCDYIEISICYTPAP